MGRQLDDAHQLLVHGLPGEIDAFELDDLVHLERRGRVEDYFESTALAVNEAHFSLGSFYFRALEDQIFLGLCVLILGEVEGLFHVGDVVPPRDVLEGIGEKEMVAPETKIADAAFLVLVQLAINILWEALEASGGESIAFLAAVDQPVRIALFVGLELSAIGIAETEATKANDITDVLDFWGSLGSF